MRGGRGSGRGGARGRGRGRGGQHEGRGKGRGFERDGGGRGRGSERGSGGRGRSGGQGRGRGRGTGGDSFSSKRKFDSSPTSTKQEQDDKPAPSSITEPIQPPKRHRLSTILIPYHTSECTHWYTYGQDDMEGRNDILTPSEITSHTLDSRIVDRYRQEADWLYEEEMRLFRSQDHKGSFDRDRRWVDDAAKKGTLKDRIAAMSVLLGEDPIHRLDTLDSLLHLAGAPSASQSGRGQQHQQQQNMQMQQQRVVQFAAEALVDVFLSTLLPLDRKLISLSHRPLHKYEKPKKPTIKEGEEKDEKQPLPTQRTLSPKLLLLWRYEEYLQQRYQTFLSLLHLWLQQSTSERDLIKTQTLKHAVQLLTHAPQGEAQLLRMVVNKLGDYNRRVAGVAAEELHRMLETHHQAMTAVVARYVQEVVYRPALGDRGLFQCVMFLNRLKLVREDDSDDDDDHEEEDTDSDNDDHEKKDEMTVSSYKSGPNTQRVPLAVSLMRTYFHILDILAVREPPEDGQSVAGSKYSRKSRSSRYSRHSSKRKRSSIPSSNRTTSVASIKSKSSFFGDASTVATVATVSNLAHVEGKLFTAILTGVHRAYPYLPRKYASMEPYIDCLYRMAMQVNQPSGSTMALVLLHRFLFVVPQQQEQRRRQRERLRREQEEEALLDEKEVKKKKKKQLQKQQEQRAKEDRFYRAVYAKMTDVRMYTSKHATMFYNMLYKLMTYEPFQRHKKTSSSAATAQNNMIQEGHVRVVAMAKRLLHVTIHAPTNTWIMPATLYLVSEVMKKRPEALVPVLYLPQVKPALAGTGSESNKYQGETVVVKLDPSKRDPRGAFVVHEGKSSNANTTAATTTTTITTKEKKKKQTDSDEDSEASASQKHFSQHARDKHQLLHLQTEARHSATVAQKVGACSMWEVCLLHHHFHPTYAKLSHEVGRITLPERKEADDEEDANYENPWSEVGLAALLDKFAYRHSKSVLEKMQEKEDGRSKSKQKNDSDDEDEEDGTRKKKSKKEIVRQRRQRAIPVNNPRFLEQSRSEVAAEELFFYPYFEERRRRDARQGIVRGKEAKDDDNVRLVGSDEEFEQPLDGSNIDWDKTEDPEEEEFVAGLAQKLIDKHAKSSGMDFDHEDPDTEGWGDLYDDEEDEDADVESDAASHKETNGDVDDTGPDDEHGNVLDDEQDSEDEEMDQDEDDEDEDGMAAALLAGEDYSDDDDVEAAMLEEHDDDDDDDDDEGEEETSNESLKKNKKKSHGKEFADMDDYAELIEKSVAERERMRGRAANDDGFSDQDEHEERRSKTDKKSKSERGDETSKDRSGSGKVKKQKKKRRR